MGYVRIQHDGCPCGSGRDTGAPGEGPVKTGRAQRVTPTSQGLLGTFWKLEELRRDCCLASSESMILRTPGLDFGLPSPRTARNNFCCWNDPHQHPKLWLSLHRLRQFCKQLPATPSHAEPPRLPDSCLREASPSGSPWEPPSADRTLCLCPDLPAAPDGRCPWLSALPGTWDGAPQVSVAPSL